MRIIIKTIGVLLVLLTFSCKSDYSQVRHSINTNLFLASSIDNETGEMIGEGSEFVIMDNGWVEASLDLSDYLKEYKENIMIHFDWVDELGNSFYKKKQILTKDTTKVNTAVSIDPELRKPGFYALNIYVFRELLVSKKFILRPAYKTSKNIQEKIDLYTKANRKTKKQLEKDIVIHLMKDKWIKASVKLTNIPQNISETLLYQINWIDNKGEIFYKKKFAVKSTTSKQKTIDCSIEVAPNKKEIGHYRVQLLLFGNIIADKAFWLKKEHAISKIETTITLYKKSRNKTKVGIGKDFIMTDKNKVKVAVEINNCFVFGKKEPLHFKLVWIDTNNKPFYTKRLTFTPKTKSKTLRSSISIAPSKKRKPGKYKIQLYLFNQLVSESDFFLHKI